MSPTARERALVAAGASLVLLVVLSPWPFGAVAPRFAASLTAALTLLAGFVLAVKLASGEELRPPPAGRWLAAAALFVVLQQIPWPSALVRLAAPGVDAVHGAAEAALEHDLSFRPLTVEPFQTRFRGLELLGLAGAFFLSYALFTRSRARLAFAYALAATGVALSLFAVYQQARFGTVLYGRFPTASGTPFGPFVNHNHFAGYVEALALVTLGVAIRTARRSGALAFLLCGAATVMGIAHVLSQSRGGLLAAVSGLLALLWIGNEDRRRHGYLLAAGLGAVALFLAAFSTGGLVDRWARLGDGDDSVAFRVQLWSDSLRLAGTSPLLGSGLGTYAAVIPAHRTGPDETRAEFAESDWIQHLCETGIAGLGVALGLLLTVLAAGRRALRAERSRAVGLREGAFAAVVALAIHGLFDFNLHIPSNALLFAVLLGLLPGHDEPRGSRSAARRPLAAAAAGALALGIALHAVALGESRELGRRVDPVLTEPSELAPTIAALVASREQVPSNPRTAFLLGRLYNEEAYRARVQERYRDVRLGQASEAFREALALAPARGRTWFELAWTEASRGNGDVADRLFPRAFELEPHWADLRANYALYLAATGRVDEALDQIELARSLDPGLAPADALAIVGPHVEGDPRRLRRAAGEGEAAERALARFADGESR